MTIITRQEAYQLIRADGTELVRLIQRASALRDVGHGRIVTYSRKVVLLFRQYRKSNTSILMPHGQCASPPLGGLLAESSAVTWPQRGLCASFAVLPKS